MNRPTLFYMFLFWYWASSSSTRMTNIDLKKSYTANWAVQLHSSANDDDADFIANSLGLTYRKILPDNYYLLTDEHNQASLDKPNDQITEELRSFSEVKWVEQQVAEPFEYRTKFLDPLWKSQNHLQSNSGNKINQHIEEVWANGYAGNGVTVVVIDDGVRGTHRELRSRYDRNISTTIRNSSSQNSFHGTRCAGVIAAQANNSLCGVGVAYGCKIAGIRLFVDGSATDADVAQAFYRNHINPFMGDIFSNSWGPLDVGYIVSGPGHLAAQALKNGVEKGRNGLGSIYVFSCGNGADVHDSCAFDGYVNSIYTIAVASITKNGKVTEFSERCSAIMTAVYSTDMITISDKDDSGCVSDFGRTSAAASFVSGILALALEANRNITWRDMQHLVARSSNWNNVDPAVKHVKNGKGYKVNENFGFGVLDASALVNNAKQWNVSVPDQVMCTFNVIQELGIQTIPTKLNINVTKDNLNCESKLINSLEHIQLRVDLSYTNRAVLAIDVQSMSGTSSRMVYPRTLDTIGNPPTYNNLVVTSVHFWEEPLLGIWTVNIVEETPIPRINGTGTLFNMTLVFYGTEQFLKRRDNETDHKNDKPTPRPKWLEILEIVGPTASSCFLLAGVVGVGYKLKHNRSNRSAQNDVREDDGEELSENKDALASTFVNKVTV